MRKEFEAMVRDAQGEICSRVAEVDGDGSVFQRDSWSREGGGGGTSCVLQNGRVFEKAGVNVSVVHGNMPKEAMDAATGRGVNRATGVKDATRSPSLRAESLL